MAKLKAKKTNMPKKQKIDSQKRGSGILLHITSLPSPFGIGDLGEGAYKFADFLAETKQSYWQILPLNLTAPILGNSPYSSYSAFAGNYLLISPDLLVKERLLTPGDLEGRPSFPADRVDYPLVIEYKTKILKKTFENYKSLIWQDKKFEGFCRDNAYWLEDYALFIALKEKFNGAVWNNWPPEFRDRKKETLKEAADALQEKILSEKFFQYLFFRQWEQLKAYCNGKSIKIIGDIPIYVNHDSSDAWVNPGIFKLNKDGSQAFLAGVPPDFFSSTGQLWGNPVYDWAILKQKNYSWWLDRFRMNLKLFDIVRLDHFRGFIAYWEVPAGEKTAVKGQWVKAPAIDFFSKLLRKFPTLSIIAEDLGHITDDVRAIIRAFHFPGMKLLLFAFDDTPKKNPYIPHNHIKNCVIYSGTHDNNTVRGWFEKEARPEDRNRIFHYIGREIPSTEITWEFIRLAMMSVADTAILPMQDILNLGEEARMNRPATIGNNWQWRMTTEMLSPWVTAKLREITEIHARA